MPVVVPLVALCERGGIASARLKPVGRPETEAGEDDPADKPEEKIADTPCPEHGWLLVNLGLRISFRMQWRKLNSLAPIRSSKVSSLVLTS